MIYHKTEDDKLAECARLIKEDEIPSSDRASISSFYNGLETLSPGEAADRNVSSLTNHLLGFDPLKAAHEQLNNIYARPKELWGYAIDGPWEEAQKDAWAMEMAKDLNQIIKRSRRFKPEWNGVTGEITLHGRGVMLHKDNFDWCPQLSFLYVPRGTGVTPESITYGCIPNRLTVSDLERYLKAAERDGSSWNKKAIQETLDWLKNPDEPPINHESTTSAVERAPEIQEHEAQSGVGGNTHQRTSIPVYYFYEVDHSKPGKPVSLTILADHVASFTRSNDETDADLPEKTLFKKRDHFESVNHWAHLFFVDCYIGGPTSYHRTMGLGRLNYEADVDIEEFFNDYLQGVRDAMRRVWKMKNSSDIETARQFQSEFQNIIPEGFDAVQFQHIPNFQHALAPLQFLRQASKSNANAAFSNQGIATGEELEVQAIERQSRSASAVANRMADVYECLDALGEEITRRFIFAPNPTSSLGYAEVAEFRERMKEKGIPIEEIGKMRNGQFLYLKVKTSREAGDGNAVMENMVNGTLIQNLGLYSPEAQQLIKRKFTASLTKDSDLAEVLVPYQQEPDPDQEMDADQENDLAMREGILGVPIPTRRRDIDMRHIPRHFRGLQALLAKGEIRGWDEMDVAGFKSLAAHTVLHIQNHGAIKANTGEARGLMTALQNMASQGDKFIQNLQQKRESERLTPLDQAKIINMDRKAALDARKQEALEEDRRNRTQLELMELAQKEVDSAEERQENPTDAQRESAGTAS